MRRREFIALLGGTAAWPGVVCALGSTRVRRVGILLYSDPDRAVIAPLLVELRALGYIEGKTIAFEYRIADGDYARLPQMAAELAALNPDVIFSYSGELAPVVKNATAQIPIVVVVSNDPVASGLVTSLSHPGGNITGVTYVHDQLAGKTIELLREVAPAISRVAVMWNPNHADPEFRETQRGAQTLGVQLLPLEVRQQADFANAYQVAMREKAEAVIVVGSRVLALQRQQIADFAAKNRMILVGTPYWLAEVGALLTYGPDVAELHRRAASYVDKILRGARAADLPMQQPATFKLTINLKAAQSLGIAISPTLMARADEVIQ